MIEGNEERLAVSSDEETEEDRIEIFVDDEGEAPTEGGLESQSALAAELETAREQLLRTAADFENYRKRNERERSEIRRHAVADALKEFLLVLDNLDLAVSSKGSFEDLRSGVEMVVKQMRSVLSRFGVEEIAAAGEPFDPAIHDAIARFEDQNVSTQVVAEELQKGYMMGDRLLRPSMVRVAVPVAPTGVADEADDGEEMQQESDDEGEGERPT